MMSALVPSCDYLANVLPVPEIKTKLNMWLCIMCYVLMYKMLKQVEHESAPGTKICFG